MNTYNLCRKLFNNYALMERDYEVDTLEEELEVHDLVQAMIDTPPMQVAQKYVEEMTGETYTRERWYNTIMRLWFERFSQGSDPHLTGFEHVVVGEGEGTEVQGYHFWYRYFLDDGFAREVDGSVERFPGLNDDRITYQCSMQEEGQDKFPESVTFKFRWLAPDYDNRNMHELKKRKGGFFVGCSVEGLLALGTVRALGGPQHASIEGAMYSLKMFTHNGRHIRTFWPEFQRAVISPISNRKLRIIAALINPKGHDPGKETVTLINLGDSDEQLDGLRIQDKNSRSDPFNGTLHAGDTLRITLTGEGAQLVNSKDGTILLLDGNNNDNVIHSVSYHKAEAAIQGQTLLFGDH